MTASAETIPFLVTFGFPRDGTLNLRFPPEHQEEILFLLDENGIEHGTILEFSADTQLAIEAVTVLLTAGGLAALASVYKTFVHRHDGKRVVLKRGEFEVEATGFSSKKTEDFLREIATEQLEVDSRWREMVEEQPQNETD